MRRQLNTLVLAVTLLVIVAFVGPLAFIVSRQADQRARVGAEHEAQSVAANMIRSISGSELSVSEAAASIRTLPSNVSIVLGGEVLAGQISPNLGLAALAVAESRAESTYTDRGWELALPVLTSAETVVVYSVVSSAVLRQGVARAWALLAILSVGLVVASLMVADGLGRAVVQPSRRIADAALRLGSGDLNTRVEEEGPPELKGVAAAFNVLAARLRDLLAAEREAMADLSHRLRTPLTAVRLETEALKDANERKALIDQLNRLELAVDDLISEARLRSGSTDEKCDLAEVVRARVEFWEVLASEQGRAMTSEISDDPVYVKVRPSEAAAAVDALVDNVFSHTAAGVGFEVKVASDDSMARVVVADQGQGFRRSDRVVERGVSTGGSTGLGLDIVRRLAERTGGALRLGRSSAGGAEVDVSFPLA